MKPLNLNPNRNYLTQPTTPVDIPEWRKSLVSFGEETKALGSGLTALGAQVVGSDETRDKALADYQQTMEGASSGALTPEVGRIEDIKLTEDGGMGRLGSYLGYQVPKGIAQLGSLVVGGMGAGAVAKAIASKKIKTLAKQHVKDMALKSAKKQVETPLVKQAAGKVAAEQLARRQIAGATGGVVAGGFGMETGQTYGKFANDPEIGPEAAVGPALAYGGVAGVLEFLPIAAGAKAIGLDRMLLRKLIKETPKLAEKAVDLSLKQRALKAAGKVAGGSVAGGLTEGITEGMQSLAQLAAERYAKEDPEWASIVPRTPEEWSGLWNEMAAGAATGFFVGAGMGPFAGAPQAKQPPPKQPPPTDQITDPAPITEPVVQPLIAQEPTPTDVQTPTTPAQTPAEPPAVQSPEAPVVAAPQTDQVAQPETVPESAEVVPEGVELSDPGLENKIPFVKAEAAAAAIVRTGREASHEVVEVPGGFGIAPRGDVVRYTTSPQPQAAPQPAQFAQPVEETADALPVQENPEAAPGVPNAATAQNPATQDPAAQGAVAAVEPSVEVPVEVIRKADGTVFGTRAAATSRMNQLWNKGELTIQKGKEAGKQARAKVVPEGDGYVIEKLESRNLDEDSVSDTNSTGQLVHPTPEGRENFKKWFAGSKVVDAQGRPLVVYHGTKRDFTEFKSAYPDGLIFFTTNPEFAGTWPVGSGGLREPSPENKAEYERLYKEQQALSKRLFGTIEEYNARTDAENEAIRQQLDAEFEKNTGFRSPFDYEHKAGIQVMPAYLSVQKPFDPRTNWQEMEDFLRKNVSAGLVKQGAHKAGNWVVYESKAVIDELKRRGYDGIWLAENIGGPHETIAAFYPEQAKSASGNRGTYEQGNPNILESRDTEPVSTPEDLKGADLWAIDSYRNSSITPKAIQESSTGTPVKVRAYHGTRTGIEEGKFEEKTKSYNGFYAAADRETALGYAGRYTDGADSRVYEVDIELDNPLVVDYEGKEYFGSQTNSIVDLAKAKGHDGVVIKNIKDPTLTTTYVVFNKDSVSSPGVLFSQAGTARPTQSTADFVAATDAVLGQGWTQRAIDAGILKINETSPEGTRISGSFNPKTDILTINLDRIPRRQTAVDVLLHEGSHAGMEQMLGRQFKSFHADLGKLIERKDPTAALAIMRSTRGSIASINAHREDKDLEPFPHKLDDKEFRTLPAAERNAEVQRVRKLINELNPKLLPEEDLAYYVQTASSTAPASVGYWKRLKAALQAWFAGTGFGKALATIGWRPEMSPELGVELAKAASRQTLAQAELVNKLVGDRAAVLRELPAGASAAFLESAVWNADSQTGDVLESRNLDDWWRSGVEEAIAGAPQNKAQPEQWIGWLKKQPGVKQEELDDLGLEDWLKAQEGVVTKQAVEQLVKDGGVQVEEKVLKQYKSTEQMNVPYDDEVKFSDYTLPGGEGYRELLITSPQTNITPDNLPASWEVVDEGGMWVVQNNDRMSNELPLTQGYGKTKEEAISMAIAEEPALARDWDGKLIDTYTSPHYKEANILVHLRFNERKDVEGKRVLFVEEVQSDWHQEGRKRGYKGINDVPKEVPVSFPTDVELEAELNVLDALPREQRTAEQQQRQSEVNQYLEFGTGPLEEQATLYRAAQRNSDELDALSAKGVPDAPLKSSWPLLGMKRAIRWAAQNGFDKVAWPKGAEALQYPGGWDGPPTLQDGEWITSTGKIVTGLVNLYNKGLPQHLSKYGKKFGARVGTTEIDTTIEYKGTESGDIVPGGEEFGLDDATIQLVWSIPITPRLKEEALSGQLLYSFPPMHEWKEPHTWLTSPISTIPDDYNVPGVFNKVFHGMVDRFHYVKDKSSDLYRAFDEWKNRQGALQQEVQRTFEDPMQRLVSRYRPPESDAEPIRQAQIAAGAEKETYTTVEIAGHQLAARHILEDKVTEKLALKAAPTFLEELKEELTPHNVGRLNKDIKAMTGDSVDIKKLTKQQARQLFLAYLPSKKPKSDIGERWTLYNRRSAGYSIATPGTKAAKEDTAAGFINAHELYTTQVKGREIFQQIGELSDQLAAHQLKLLQEGGLLEQDGVDRLSNAYKHYVPLRREAFDYDQELKEMFEKPVANVGKLMTRKGSIELASAVHVIQNHLASGFTAASAAARNQMMNKFADVVYKDQAEWKPWFYIKDERVHKNDVGFVRNGKPLYIVPQEGNLRAASIVKVIAGKDVQELSGPLKVMRTLNNWVRWSNVSASPAFMLANTPRDYLTAVYNLQASDAKDYAKEIASLKNYKESFRALKKVMMEGVRESTDPQEQQWIELVEDFEQAGGKTSFVEAMRAMDGDSWKSFEARVGRRQGKLGSVVEFGRDQLERIENLNIVLENVMRLSTYKVMRDKYQADKGMSEQEAKERAAEIARNLTTNFTRRGAHIDAMNTWWLFYNATVQGNWQVIQNLLLNPNKAGQKRLQKAVAGTILFAFLIDQLGRAMSDDEDDDGVSDWDSRPGYEKDRKISAPFSVGGVYPSVPSPWVFNVFWRLGGMLGEVKDGVLKPQDAVLDSMGLMFTSMNPVSGGTVAQAVAPTAADPFMQILENRNFVGNPLGPDGYPGSTTRPDAYLAWDSTPGIYKHAAEFVNSITGGSPVESGEMDFRPSSYKVLADFALGSLGRTVLDLGKLGLSPVMDDMNFEGPEKIPGLKVFLSAPNDSTAISLYHDRVAKVLGAKRLLKLYGEGAERNPEKLAKVQQDRAAVLRLVPQVEDTERQIKSLRKTLRAARARKDSRTEEMLQDRIVQLQKRFNQSYSRRVGH